jgi:hypothetical protein
MSKPWVGYLGSFFVLLAGVFQIAAEKPILGSILIVLSIAGAIIKFYMMRNDDTNK